MEANDYFASLDAEAYGGRDLGAAFTPDQTVFKLWAPEARDAAVVLYEFGRPVRDETPLAELPMRRAGHGVWAAEAAGNLQNRFYLYRVTHRDGAVTRSVDPYAKAVGVNGLRGMVVNLRATDPQGFRSHKKPPFSRPTDAVIYELHLRDLSMDPHSGIRHKGLYLGLAEADTVNSAGDPTGLSHIRSLGVTHVHLLPCFDFASVDETGGAPAYNWGYDPLHYNTPEGSYATNPYDGSVRIYEFKKLIHALHAHGLRVVMDVVYNHTAAVDGGPLDGAVPGYYYRRAGGAGAGYANGSGCGNEIASERAMARKYIVESVCFWAREYRIDGFRFDLMGLHDVTTMNAVRHALYTIDPSIIVYGEGWTAGPSPLPERVRAVKANAALLDAGVAVFSDDLRDALRGGVFLAEEPGFVAGDDAVAAARREQVKFGVAGATAHPQVDLAQVHSSAAFWAASPTQAVNYVSCHDNLTLWDKLQASCKDAPTTNAGDANLIALNKLAAAAVFTSQGIPFFQAGEEFGRSKGGRHNTYNAPDAVNALDWDQRTRRADLVEYYRGLITLRKAFPAFRLPDAARVRAALTFLDAPPAVAAYTLAGGCPPYDALAVFLNGSVNAQVVTLPPGLWDVLVNGDRAGAIGIARVSGAVNLPAKTALVLGRQPETSGPGDALDTPSDQTPVIA